MKPLSTRNPKLYPFLRSIAKDRLQSFEAAQVLCWSADGNAYPFGELISSHGANDDASFLQFDKDLLAVSNAHQDEIGSGWDKLQF